LQNANLANRQETQALSSGPTLGFRIAISYVISIAVTGHPQGHTALCVVYVENRLERFCKKFVSFVPPRSIVSAMLILLSFPFQDITITGMKI